MDTSTRARTITLAGIISGSLLFAGCSAGAGVEPTASDRPSPNPTDTTPPVASALPYAVPAAQEGERARAVFEEDGPDGIPTTTVTAVAPLTVGETAVVTGACIGDSVDFLLATATPSPDTLLTGTIDCSSPIASFRYEATAYTGAVQLSFTDNDDVTDAWAVFVAEPGGAG